MNSYLQIISLPYSLSKANENELSIIGKIKNNFIYTRYSHQSIYDNQLASYPSSLLQSKNKNSKKIAKKSKNENCFSWRPCRI